MHFVNRNSFLLLPHMVSLTKRFLLVIRAFFSRIECTIGIQTHHQPIHIIVVPCLKDRPLLSIHIRIMTLIKSSIPTDPVSQSFHCHLVKIPLRGIHFSLLLNLWHTHGSSLFSDYDMYTNYRGDPYAAAASGQAPAPLRHDLPVAYQQHQHQQQQLTGYPPSNPPRQTQQAMYGNATGAPSASYAPAHAQYYGAQQRA
jgi:hypothetical protein